MSTAPPPAGRGTSNSLATDPLDAERAQLAIDAWRRFGKGHHRAGPNYGDCFTYALAVTTQLPVLCVGDDLTHTDVGVVSP